MRIPPSLSSSLQSNLLHGLRQTTRLNSISSRAVGLRSISSSSSSNLNRIGPFRKTTTARVSPLSTTSSRLLKPQTQSLTKTRAPTAANSPAVEAARRAYSSISGHDTGSAIQSSAFVETTTLSNGVRVATETTPGHFSAVGVYIDAGSRFERNWVPGESGVSHLLDRLAFKVSRGGRGKSLVTVLHLRKGKS